MKKRIIQGVTLTSFLTLIGLFVAYKGGYIGNSGQTISLDPNGTVLQSNQNDSIPPRDSIVDQKIYMPSSKVMVIDDRSQFQKDSAAYHQLIGDDKKRTYMFSTKSAIVVDNDDFQLKIDTTWHKDSSEKQK